jgi:hypothetical protein
MGMTSMPYRSNKKRKFKHVLETGGPGVNLWSITVFNHSTALPPIQLSPTIVRIDMPLVRTLNTNSLKK